MPKEQDGHRKAHGVYRRKSRRAKGRSHDEMRLVVRALGVIVAV